MPRTPDFIEVSLGQPIAPGAGRSIGIDLKETVRTKINGIQTTILDDSITATQVQPAIINSETKTVSLLPIENMETNFFNIYRRSVGPVHGQKHSVALNLTATWKSKINNIKAIENEATNIQNQIYPVNVSGTTVKVLPIMPRTPDFVEVSLGQPVAQGAGRTIGIDLKDTIRTKINNMQTVILNDSITATQVQPAIIRLRD
ncbi:MAG UNVERIFIED_CONTAM: hypothetical protein LVQ98_05575 [Rickettsiaceae bacterium]|jgi:hypothetical protein